MKVLGILLVEDSEDDAFFFKYEFKSTRLTAEVHHAVNGSTAIDFLNQARDSNLLPQIMFLDLKMPVLNGFEVLSWLQNQPFSAQIKVFVLSGSEQQADKERAIRLGAVEYLVKPITQVDLLRIVASTLANQSPVSPAKAPA